LLCAMKTCFARLKESTERIDYSIRKRSGRAALLASCTRVRIINSAHYHYAGLGNSPPTGLQTPSPSPFGFV
jgi:hypothetical protein